MSRAERFLRDATRGLGRKARLEAQAELRSHLHERVQHLRLEGVPEADASAQAMRELGPAATVRRSLWSAHPPLHLLWWVGLITLTLWTGWSLRDVQSTQGSFVDADRYGHNFSKSGQWRGWSLDAWASRLPPEARIESIGGEPVLVLSGTRKIPLTGGSLTDRPLSVAVEGFGWLDELMVRESFGNYRPLIPVLHRYRHVRGPYLSLWYLSKRAFRLGLSVDITHQREYPLVIAGVRLPAEPMTARPDWADALERQLLTDQIGQLVPAAAQPSVFPLRFSETGLDILRVEPGATYRLGLRLEQQVTLPTGLADTHPAVAFSLPVTADEQGVLRLASLVSPSPDGKSAARLYPDLLSWANAPLDRDAYPAVLVKIDLSPDANRNLTVWPDTARLGQPLELALTEP